MENSLQDIFGITGKVALVTGSSRGIGAAIAEGLALAGANVVVHGRTLKSTGNTVAKIRNLNRTVWFKPCDLSVVGSGKKLIKEVIERTGKLDILVLNASLQINATLEEMAADDLQMHFNANLRSTVELLQESLPHMVEQGWGRVVNIGSINQSRPKNIVMAYASMKAAQHNIIQSLARDYAKTGVVLNTLAPGLIDTDRNMERKTSDPVKWNEYVQNLNWMGRIGLPTEMVGAAIFLSSNSCSFMTGETIYLTGGY